MSTEKVSCGINGDPVKACIELVTGVQWIVTQPRADIVDCLLTEQHAGVRVEAVVEGDEYRKASFIGTVFASGVVSVADVPEEFLAAIDGVKGEQ